MANVDRIVTDLQPLVAVIGVTITAVGVVFGGFVAVVRFTVFTPLAGKLDRYASLLASHTHDDDGEVVAPIVNGRRR